MKKMRGGDYREMKDEKFIKEMKNDGENRIRRLKMNEKRKLRKRMKRKRNRYGRGKKKRDIER